MREALGPYRAALTQGRRRSIMLLVFIVLGIFGAISWSNFRPLQEHRDFLKELERGNITVDNFFDYAPGVACQGGFEVGPPGPPPEPTASPEASPPGAPRSNQQTCQFIGPNGQPFGPPLQGDPFDKFRFGPPSQAEIDEFVPFFRQAARDQVALAEKELGPRRLLDGRIRTLGTLFGVVFAVVFASTFFGAEMRWGVWRTLLTHEPRRGRMLVSKFAAMWTYVIAGVVLALVVSGAVDVVMRQILDVEASGGPSIARIAKDGGWTVLSLTTYATIASALTVSVRTSLAGAVSLLVLLGDHLLVSRFVWLRPYSAVQQVASLLSNPAGIAEGPSGYAWPPQILERFRCVRRAGDTFSECAWVMLKPLPHWRASLVLGAWIVAFALAAWAVLRARDVPQ